MLEIHPLPCPFCGNDATQTMTLVIRDDSKEEIRRAELCLNCNARGPEHSNKFDAQDGWNVRK